jgi:hypothetical protein
VALYLLLFNHFHATQTLVVNKCFLILNLKLIRLSLVVCIRNSLNLLLVQILLNKLIQITRLQLLLLNDTLLILWLQIFQIKRISSLRTILCILLSLSINSRLLLLSNRLLLLDSVRNSLIQVLGLLLVTCILDLVTLVLSILILLGWKQVCVQVLIKLR